MSSKNEIIEIKKLISDMKNCSHILNDIVIGADVILPEEDFELLKIKVGEFLGYLYLDIYRKHVIENFPELAGELESE
jgi:hypothetical protein